MDITLMAASRLGAQYSKAVAFLISPLVDIQTSGYCVTFPYSLRSNLKVKITSNSYTATLANWIVDGGRAFHHAALDLPQGIYKIIWETTDNRKDFVTSETPYNRYLVTVDDITIHTHECFDVGNYTEY